MQLKTQKHIFKRVCIKKSMKEGDVVDIPCIKSDNCTGCGTCAAVCPHVAIKLLEDEIGQCIPVIEKEKCINCHACESFCPENNPVSCHESMECYAAISKSDYLYNTTSSGGVATAISEMIINDGGVVYGASYSDAVVKHIRVETKDGLEYLKGSKYVQSCVSDCFPLIKQDLLKGRKVLFIGTPCQTAGVKSYLKKLNSDNLLLIDLVCHGAPPMTYLREYVSSRVGAIPVQDVVFRVKNWKLGINREYEPVYNRINVHDLFCYAFAKGIIFRESCYHCRYAQPKRCGDITLGDFWGLEKTNLPHKAKSMVLINTVLGKKYWEICKSEFDYEQRSVAEAINGNSQLKAPSNVPDERKAFLKRYKKYGFTKALCYSSVGINTSLLRLKHKLTGRKAKGGYGMTILKK